MKWTKILSWNNSLFSCAVGDLIPPFVYCTELLLLGHHTGLLLCQACICLPCCLSRPLLLLQILVIWSICLATVVTTAWDHFPPRVTLGNIFMFSFTSISSTYVHVIPLSIEEIKISLEFISPVCDSQFTISLYILCDSAIFFNVFLILLWIVSYGIYRVYYILLFGANIF